MEPRADLLQRTGHCIPPQQTLPHIPLKEEDVSPHTALLQDEASLKLTRQNNEHKLTISLRVRKPPHVLTDSCRTHTRVKDDKVQFVVLHIFTVRLKDHLVFKITSEHRVRVVCDGNGGLTNKATYWFPVREPQNPSVEAEVRSAVWRGAGGPLGLVHTTTKSTVR